MSRSDGSTADYYVLPEGATQLQDLISHRNMNAQIGEITRACYRYGMASHSDMLRDAKKIRFYAQAEVERLEKLSAGVSIPASNTYIVGEQASEQTYSIWLEAPKEATHYTAADEDNYAAFWREEGGVFTECWTSGDHYTGARYKPEPHLLQSRPTSTVQ
jgi:hypothetical protein